MSPELYEAIQKGELKLGGEKREITILISDIRGFTRLSESMDPEELVSLLNRYFETQVAVIQKYGGTVDKFMGDSILAKFGAPAWHPDHARRAVLAMLDMRSALAEFNQDLRAQGVEPLRIGISANTGTAVVGNIGSTARMDYTIIGDTVNVAERIGEPCKTLGQDLLISDTTFDQAKGLAMVLQPHRITLRGRQQETFVYPLVGLERDAAVQLETASVASVERENERQLLTRAAPGSGQQLRGEASPSPSPPYSEPTTAHTPLTRTRSSSACSSRPARMRWWSESISLRAHQLGA